MLLSKSVTHGIRALCFLSHQPPERLVTASMVAEAAAIPRQQASKILQRLALAGIITSVRGRRGGYCLARLPDAILMDEVLTALSPHDTHLAIRACAMDEDELCRCDQAMDLLWQHMRAAVGGLPLGGLLRRSHTFEPQDAAMSIVP